MNQAAACASSFSRQRRFCGSFNSEEPQLTITILGDTKMKLNRLTHEDIIKCTCERLNEEQAAADQTKSTRTILQTNMMPDMLIRCRWPRSNRLNNFSAEAPEALRRRLDGFSDLIGRSAAVKWRGPHPKR